MTRVNGTDQILLLLHEQLARLSKERSGRRASAGGVPNGVPEPMTRLRALAARNGLSEDDLKRALIRGVLAQQFGDGVASGPEFEAISGEVMRIIGESGPGRDLLERALQQLGTSGPDS